MVGKQVDFICANPDCKLTGILELGITQYVNIKGKGDNLAIQRCPKCGHTIAFRDEERKSIHFRHDLKIHGNARAINRIESLVTDNISNGNTDEYALKASVLTTLRSEFGEAYVDKYYVEIIQVFELSLTEKTALYGSSYDLALIPKEDLEDAGVVAW